MIIIFDLSEFSLRKLVSSQDFISIMQLFRVEWVAVAIILVKMRKLVKLEAMTVDYVTNDGLFIC